VARVVPIVRAIGMVVVSFIVAVVAGEDGGWCVEGMRLRDYFWFFWFVCIL